MNFITNFLNAGVEADMKLSHVSRIKIINASIFLAAINIVLYNISYFFFAPGLAISMITIPTLCIVAILLSWFANKHNRVLLGTQILLIFSMLSVFYIARYFIGPNFGYQSYFLVFALLPFVFFTRKNRLLSILYSIVNFGAYLYLDKGIYSYTLTKNHAYFNQRVASVFQYTNIIIAFLSILIVMLIFDAIINKDEEDLVQALEKAEYNATYDFLTDVLNRRAMTAILNERFSDIYSESLPVTLLMIDIDDFKVINDVHGHLVGDIALKELCKIMKNYFQNGALLSRWGGEEFIVYLNNTSLADGTDIAEGLRYLVNKTNVTDEVVLSMSIGVASRLNNETYSSVLNRADHMMYNAKLSGKNKVVNHI